MDQENEHQCLSCTSPSTDRPRSTWDTVPRGQPISQQGPSPVPFGHFPTDWEEFLLLPTFWECWHRGSRTALSQSYTIHGINQTKQTKETKSKQTTQGGVIKSQRLRNKEVHHGGQSLPQEGSVPGWHEQLLGQKQMEKDMGKREQKENLEIRVSEVLLLKNILETTFSQMLSASHFYQQSCWGVQGAVLLQKAHFWYYVSSLMWIKA